MATTGRAPPPFDPDDDDDLHVIAASQRLELAAAQAADDDLDLAFHLQMQEALTASLSLHPSTSSSALQSKPATSTIRSEPDTSFSTLQAEYLEKFDIERRDRLVAEAEMRREKADLLLRSHDHHVAAELLNIPEHEWQDTGDYFQRPFGEGTSHGTGSSEFRVYCKGLVSEEGGVVLAGIGVAICDSADNLVFEMRKPVAGAGRSRQVVEMKAVIEGLNAAIALDLKRVVVYFDYYPLYKYVTGRWTPKQQKTLALVNHLKQLCGKFEYAAHSIVARNDIKFAFKFAREAMVSQVNRPSESSSVKNLKETCDVCLEDKDVGQFFAVDNCSHHYCCSCMKQHVEVKLLHGMVPTCPHEGCNSELKIERCTNFLTPKFIEMMTHRLKEASIPVTEKVYCPYPKCSFLMTKTEVLEYSGNTDHITQPGRRTCMKCEQLFCINCKVPWHNNMSCRDYKIKNPHPPVEDVKLKTLANRYLWRQCIKCNHMIELDSGCYHMTCRCGYEFCYTCGAEWKNKKATCSCPLWDEHNILDDDYESNEELSDSDDSDSDSDLDDYY